MKTFSISKSKKKTDVLYSSVHSTSVKTHTHTSLFFFLQSWNLRNITSGPLKSILVVAPYHNKSASTQQFQLGESLDWNLTFGSAVALGRGRGRGRRGLRVVLVVLKVLEDSLLGLLDRHAEGLDGGPLHLALLILGGLEEGEGAKFRLASEGRLVNLGRAAR